MDPAVGADWPELLAELACNPGVTLLLGATDCGKSTLARYLVSGLAARSVAVALVDADVGQSALCLPGCVGLRVFRSPREAADYRCDRFNFLGSANPVRVFTRLLEATGRLTDLARSEARAVIIDTTGLVEGNLGQGLKLAKIRRTRPDRIVALQRAEECEPILEKLDPVPVHRLEPHHEVRVRSQERRSEQRRERLAGYFACAGNERILQGSEIELYRLNRQLSLHHEQPVPGTVLGLDRGEFTLALAVLTEADRESITFRSPLASLSGVRRVIFGDISHDPAAV